MAFYESILASPHRTLNGEEADFFFVPVLDSCIITRAADSPHLSTKVCTYTLIADLVSILYRLVKMSMYSWNALHLYKLLKYTVRSNYLDGNFCYRPSFLIFSKYLIS